MTTQESLGLEHSLVTTIQPTEDPGQRELLCRCDVLPHRLRTFSSQPPGGLTACSLFELISFSAWFTGLDYTCTQTGRSTFSSYWEIQIKSQKCLTVLRAVLVGIFYQALTPTRQQPPSYALLQGLLPGSSEGEALAHQHSCWESCGPSQEVRKFVHLGRLAPLYTASSSASASHTHGILCCSGAPTFGTGREV